MKHPVLTTTLTAASMALTLLAFSSRKAAALPYCPSNYCSDTSTCPGSCPAGYTAVTTISDCINGGNSCSRTCTTQCTAP